jgi:mannose-6-phosphate isomerase-like protein (cupin superfamily)
MTRSDDAIAGDATGRSGAAAPIVNLRSAFDSFEAPWSPRIVGRMNDVDVKIARAVGTHVWHVHSDTDELFLVVEGELHISMRDADGVESRVTLGPWETFTVPQGVEHRPDSAGALVLFLEPRGTSSTGDRHDGEIPANVDSTTGHELD